MSHWWWVKYLAKYVEQIIYLNILYSVAAFWIFIAILYDAHPIENKIIFFAIRNGVTTETSCTFGSTKQRFPSVLASPWNHKHLSPPTRINQHICMCTKIVICKYNYSVLRFCAINVEKLYSKLYYVTFQNNIVTKFISTKPKKEKI